MTEARNRRGPWRQHHQPHLLSNPVGECTSYTKALSTAFQIVDVANVLKMVLVLTDPKGRVFVIRDRDVDAPILVRERPTWVSGVFTATAAPHDIAQAIIVTYHEHRAVLRETRKKLSYEPTSSKSYEDEAIKWLNSYSQDAPARWGKVKALHAHLITEGYNCSYWQVAKFLRNWHGGVKTVS